MQIFFSEFHSSYKIKVVIIQLNPNRNFNWIIFRIWKMLWTFDATIFPLFENFFPRKPFQTRKTNWKIFLSIVIFDAMVIVSAIVSGSKHKIFIKTSGRPKWNNILVNLMWAGYFWSKISHGIGNYIWNIMQFRSTEQKLFYFRKFIRIGLSKLRVNTCYIKNVRIYLKKISV